MKVDLHLHSQCSDGALSPKVLIDRVKKAGISFCALTDHDNVDGVERAVKRGREKGVKVLRGVELSTYERDSEFHILGYGMDLSNKFMQGLVRAQEMRKERNVLIFQKLRELGFDVHESEIYSGDGVKGRFHIAKLLVKKGYCQNVNEAFDRYIGHSGSAYVRSERYRPIDAIELITQCGGVAVLAHPSRFREEENFEKDFRALVDAGLGGVEVFYPSHTDLDRNEYLSLTKRYGLIATGGSDFHTDAGGNKIGQGNAELGQETIDYLLKLNDKKD